MNPLIEWVATYFRYLLTILFISIWGLAACSRRPSLEKGITVTVLPEETGEDSATIALTRPPPLPSATAVPINTTTRDATVTSMPKAIQDATSTTTPAPPPSRTATPTSLSVAEEMAFELISHEGGNVQCVTVQGTVAYVGVGPRLVALDVTNPAQPQPIGRSEVLPGLVTAVEVVEKGEGVRAHVAAGKQVVTLAVDLEGEMTMEDSFTLPGYVSAIVLDEGVLYSGGSVGKDWDPDVGIRHTGFVTAIDVQRPDSLRLLDVLEFPDRVTALALAEDALYVGFQGGAPDLSAIPVKAGRLGDPLRVGGVRYVSSLQVVGDTLLVGGHMQLYALDIGARTEGGRPRSSQLWRVDASSDLLLPMVEGIAAVGDTIYTVGNLPADSYIPSRLAFQAPEPLEGNAAPPASPLVAQNGHHLFVTEGNLLEIYDVSQPGELFQVGVYQPSPSVVSDLTIQQAASGSEILYLYEGSVNDSNPEELLTYRLPSLEPLGHLSIELIETEIDVGQAALFDLALGESEAFLVAGDALYKVNISDPAVPHIVARHAFTRPWFNPRGVVLLGDQVYLGKDLEFDIHIVEITLDSAGFATQTAVLQRFEGQSLVALTGADERLYIATDAYPDQSWLHVVNVSDEMELVTTLPLPAYPALALAAEGSLVAMAIEGQLLLIDVSVPDRPSIASAVALPDLFDPLPSVDDLAFHESMLYVTADSQLFALDVSHPTHPRLLGAATLPSATFPAHTLLAPSDKTIAVANGPMGILVYEVSR